MLRRRHEAEWAGAAGLENHVVKTFGVLKIANGSIETDKRSLRPL